MESTPITNTQNVINSRSLFARINWLAQQLNYRFSEEYRSELDALNEFERNIEPVASASTYVPGSDLVRDSYFQEYTRGIEEKGGGSASNATFSPVDFNGVIYWLRQPG